MNQYLDLCWLTIDDPGPYPKPFMYDEESKIRFQNWLRLLISMDNPILLYKPMVETYKHLKEQNKEHFSIDCSIMHLQNPLHRQIRDDLFEILSSMRNYYGFVVCGPDCKDMLLDILARILLYVHLLGNEYKKDLICLLIPLYHITYYGLVFWDEPISSLNSIESFTANLFYRFLNQSPIQFANPIKKFDLLDNIKAKLGPKSRLAPFLTMNLVSLKSPLLAKTYDLTYIVLNWQKTAFFNCFSLKKLMNLLDWFLLRVHDKKESFQDAITNIIFGLMKILDSWNPKNYPSYFKALNTFSLRNILVISYPNENLQDSFPIKLKND